MYRAPVDEISNTLKHVAGLGKALESGLLDNLSDDLVDAILEEAGKFASEEIAPLHEIGDSHGTPLENGAVTMPPGWRELYQRWTAGGWNGLAGPEEFGGQGLATMLQIATLEMWNSGSMAFGIGPTLTMGAVEAIDKHGSDTLKETYLAKLVSGEWTGTMNLTEPQAGSDLNALRSRAEPVGDGSYRIFGQKIFITYGEHDLTDNIIHLVLARLPDAPAGTRGISLFVVPKYLINEDGTPGERNDVFCSGIEHKLGIHASPTCTMIFGDGFVKDREPGAKGWLVGEENRGLACMFTMMNNARLAVGIQGVAVAETAWQKARDYAAERRQGRAPGSTDQQMSPIIEHPDVRRNLMTMKALTDASRAICYCCAHAIDMARATEGEASEFWQDRANLLTPLAKAFPTDAGVEVASIGVQVHGGMGFVEETGAAGLLRDSRIAPIYEGTNGIQAIDLVTRKLPLAGGEHVRGFISELREDCEKLRASNLPGFGQAAERVGAALDDLQMATEWVQAQASTGRMTDVLAGATPYLRLFALAAAGAFLVRGAVGSKSGSSIALCRFFSENLIGETAALKDRVMSGSESLLDSDSVLETA